MKKLIILLLIIAACGQVQTVRQYDEAKRLTETYLIDKKTKLKEGKYQSFDTLGNMVTEAIYHQDSLHGVRKVFFSDGTPQVIENYQHGLLHGKYTTFYENGDTSLTGAYIAGKMEGEWRGYYNNGQLKEIVQFEGSNENGPFVEYHANGQLKAKGNYLDGDQEDGLLELYDENGTLERKMQCDKGRCSTIWQLTVEENQ